MLRALARLPPGVWKPEHLEDLARIAQDALGAADLSEATSGAIEGLIVPLLSFHPGWAAPQIAALVAARGSVGLGDVWTRLSQSDLAHLAPALMPVLETWVTQEREGALIGAVRALGRRMRSWDGLFELLEARLEETLEPRFAERIFACIAANRPERLDPLVVRLLKRDPSSIALPTVHRHLHRRRQDLLGRYLGRSTLKGRFATGRTRFVLPVSDGFYRWLPSQQEQFSRTLLELIRDPRRDTPTAQWGIEAQAEMPDLRPHELAALAGRTTPAALRDTALRALARVDDGTGVPALIEALDDARVPVAIYALRASLLDVPEERALALLRQAPRNRVTVAKEVVRLLGELRSDDAFGELIRLDREDLHRDVRNALLRALWTHLDRPEAWEALHRAAASSDPAFVSAPARIPADRLSTAEERRLAGLLAALLDRPEPEAHLTVIRRCADQPIRDAEASLQPRLLHLLESSSLDEARAAATAIFALYDGAGADRIADAVRAVSPDRRRLAHTVEALIGASATGRSHLLPVSRAVLDQLAADPPALETRLSLALSSLSWPELGELLIALAEHDELHSDAVQRVLSGMSRAFAPWDGTRSDIADLVVMEDRLAAHTDPRLRRIVLGALITRSRSPRGWSEERLERLRAFRLDPSPLVAGAAQFTLPAEELG